jgi:thymidylate synthase (FAD)
LTNFQKLQGEPGVLEVRENKYFCPEISLMRKELPNTYTELENGSIGVRARTKDNSVIEYEIEDGKLVLEVDYRDKKGILKKGQIKLKPVVSKATRLDTILPSDLHVVYVAGLLCYSSLETPKLIEKSKNASPDEISEFLRKKIMPTEHWSVIEHDGSAFLSEGISRACSHQDVRHRLRSYSQQSQRYVDFIQAGKIESGIMEFPFIIPPSVRLDPELVNDFLMGVKHAVGSYFRLREGGAQPEDARYLLPNAAATRMVVSGNRRVWLELIPKRTCAKAQWEIDMLITDIAKQLWEEIPIIYNEVGPDCFTGKCKQGDKSCGRPLHKPLPAFFNNDEYPHDQLIFGMR